MQHMLVRFTNGLKRANPLATLKDIGAELGLSVATVSRALNGFPEVKPATRDKVREAADRLGYRPNRTAQRLVTGRSGMVGMIVKVRPDLTADQTFVEILTGQHHYHAGRGAYRVEVHGCDPPMGDLGHAESQM